MVAIVLLLSAYFPSHTFSQDTLQVKIVTAQMSKGSQPAYVIEIPMTTLKDLQQAWIKKLQENIKVKVVDNKGELVLPNAVKLDISHDTISLYTHLLEKEGKIIMNVFLEIDSVFFAPVEDKSLLASDKTDSNLKNYLRGFAVEQYRLGAQTRLENEQKLLKTKENELDKLYKEEENLKKENSRLENEIEKTEREISQLDQEIELKNKDLLGHKSSMLTLALEGEKEAAADKEKDMEKEIKKLEKERQKAKDDISDMKSSIEKNKEAIEDCEKEQTTKNEEITAQQSAVSQAQAFLNGIK